jgi:O-antigen/teichoic acid export membrane protein
MAEPPVSPGGGITVSVRRSVAWSGIFLIVTRLSSVAAVPLVLHRLGPDLYAAWVIAGSLVLIQSLIDLGVSGALLRFAAAAAAQDSRPALVVVLGRSLAIYGAISIVIGLPMAIWARDIADLLPYLHGHRIDEAAVIVRYAAAAFALTNLTLVLASVLQAVGRVDSSYRAQTIGWLLYLPLLYVGFETLSKVDAVGLAWVATYALQLVLLSVPSLRALRKLGAHHVSTPSWREMLSLGGRLQVSSWADYATFQLPRLIGGVALSNAQLINIDLAIRAAQVVVGPLLAFFPVVLPSVAKAWKAAGSGGVARLLERWAAPGVVACVLGTAAFLPLEGPAVAVWTGRSLSSFDTWLGVILLLGFVGHASTGLYTSALLALGDVGPVVAYKTGQLAGAAALLVPGALLGPRALAVALTLALAVPALAFNRYAARRLGVHLPGRDAVLWRRLAAGAGAAFAAGLAITLAVRHSLNPTETLGLALVPTLACAVATWVWSARAIASLPPVAGVDASLPAA